MLYFLAIDQGTTSTRAIIFNQQGQIVTQSQHNISQYYPQDGWVEHDPEEIWTSFVECCQRSLQQAELTANQIAGLGITNQRETSIVWNKKTGCPIYPAIVWQDRRTAAHCELLKKKNLEPMIQQKTGLLLDPYFSATKLGWILDNVPNARKQAMVGELLFGTVETFLLWRLTGGQSHYTDVTNACRTLLLNLHSQEWDTELLDIFKIPKILLPQIVDNHGNFGQSLAELFGASIPICALAGDQQAAAFGQACFNKGMVKSTYGTGCFMLLNTGDQIINSHHKLLTTIQYRIPGHLAYGIEGSIFIAGAAVQWLRDGLNLIQTSAQIEALAKQVEDNGGVYFIPAFTGLGAPYWNPYARGMIAGLTRDTKAAHIARACVEAVCYQTKDLMAAMQKDGAKFECLLVDGGMSVNDDLLQFLADILTLEVKRPAITETAALGIAYLIGLQLSVYASLEEISQLWQLDTIFYPAMIAEKRDQLYQKWSYWITHLNQTTQNLG